MKVSVAHLPQYYDESLLLLRLSLAVMWFAHALLKFVVFSIPGFAGWLESQGLPGFMAWPVFLLEIIGGLMILLGYYGRYISIVLMPILLVAFIVHFPNGWSHTSEGGGWEYPAFLMMISIIHFLLGDGRWALKRAD